MAFLAALAPAAAGTAAAGTAAATAGAFAAGGATSAGFASAAAMGASTAAAAGIGGSSLLAGLTFWEALSAGAQVVGTAGSILSTVAGAQQAQGQTRAMLEASALDEARTRRNLERETQRLAARRATVLSVSGGLDVGGGSDLVREALAEGSLESVQRSEDVRFQEGVLTRRFRNIGRGAGFSAIGALGSGGARLASILN